MSDRGAYRAIHCVIVDGPEFQALKPGAKLVWYTLKMTLGPSGIDVVPALVATLVERTGADEAQIKKALEQLQADGWLRIERNVVWMVDGLRHEPAFSLTNQNHRAKIRAHLAGLPRLKIVDEFRAHYGIAAPPLEMPSPPVGEVPESPSKMASKTPSKMPSTIREEGKGKREEGSKPPAAKRRRGGEPPPTWLTPFAEAWKAANGGTMSAGKAVKALATLIAEHGPDETLRRWVIYLAAKGEYANAPGFAETWGRWSAPVLRAAGGNGVPTAPPETIARAATLWPRYRTHGLLTRWPAEEYDRIGRELVAEGAYPDVPAFLDELRQTKPWELADARTDGYAINELAKRLASPQHAVAS
jgi:hypothetical protein